MDLGNSVEKKIIPTQGTELLWAYVKMDWIGPHQSVPISEMQLLRGGTIDFWAPWNVDLLLCNFKGINFENKHDSDVKSFKKR